MATRSAKSRSQRGAYLDGQLLIAMPAMGDPRFARAVIYMCAHSADGAMGIIINQRAPNINFTELLEQLNIVPPQDRIRLPAGLTAMAVHLGGPVETGRGFVLHSADYFKAESTLPIDESVCLTATIDILRDIAKGTGPDKALLALGYAGWAPGQLVFARSAQDRYRPDPPGERLRARVKASDVDFRLRYGARPRQRRDRRDASHLHFQALRRLRLGRRAGALALAPLAVAGER
jgi:putative transcriptional regulator